MNPLQQQLTMVENSSVSSSSSSSSSSSLMISNGVFSSFSTAQLELVSFRNTSYTSLKDLDPKSPGSRSFGEIPIKNRLVKQAAWAYLRPLSPSPASQDRSFFNRLGLRCSRECVRIRVDGCFLFINHGVFPAIGRAVGRLLRAVYRRNNIRNYEVNVVGGL